MRLLLDEATAPQLAAVLTALGHPSDHVRDLGISGASDQEVVNRAGDYDALVTLDLHRQFREWLAVNEAMVSGTKVIRLRFSQSEDGDLMGQTRALVRKWSEIEHAVEGREDVRLVTVSGEGGTVRETTVADIEQALLDRRS